MRNDRRRRNALTGALLIAVLTVLALSSSAVSSSPPAQPPPPREIRLGAGDKGRQVQLREGEVLVISLEANPSTGYGWEIEQAPLAMAATPILRQTGDQFVPLEEPGLDGVGETEIAHPILGAPETQMLSFQAVAAGQTTLRLVYHRPWEDSVPPADSFQVEVQAIGSFADVPAEADVESLVIETPPPAVELGADLGLPTAFNWCDLGGCSAVKNQGSCGSCWAFGTVGPLESSIRIHDGTEKDLSEQYLLSCNTNGYNCSGGWFAHDYHEWKIPPGEPDAGAVYEADFPYTARDDPCYPPHTHREKIVDWAYVGNSGSVPPVADIQQAILDHGPVSVAICIGSAFRSYPDGVFDTNEVCTGTVNHAVVLVGWDDNQGTNGIWYLKNSWGTGWGESGYMRIEYGVSKVGYAANYIEYCHALDVNANPSGTGTILTEPAPNCGGNSYVPGTEVELTAQDSPGWHFLTWGGDASGTTNPVTVTMDADKSVTAHFLCDDCTRRAQFPLGVKNYEHDPTGWLTIASEGFEGSFPGSWVVADDQTGYGEYYWGKRGCRSYEGSYSGWAVGAGANGSSLSCGSNYPNYAESWMVYGPFSLVGATAADLQFKQWVNTESLYDILCRLASLDGSHFYGSCSSGYSGGWTDAALDLSSVYQIGNLLGQPQVWVALLFESDSTLNHPEGAHVDNIVLRKYISSTGQPPPTSDISPSSGCCAQVTEQPMALTRER